MDNINPDLARVLVTTEQIKIRVKELADQISSDYAGVEQIYLIGILKGAFIFLADLSRQLNIPHVVDFMAVSSYGKTANTGAVRLIMDLREPIDGQHAIIIEDIDLMEKLGIYEVAEEDFALVEFIDTSKTEIQALIRKGLDIMRKEMS